jgi:TolB-like protein/tetratricopeptide (TPR) repeat protein
MAEERVQRRLAAIFAADVAGYSRLMGSDEEGTLQTLNLYRSVITQLVEEHEGRIVATAGDSVLAEFVSPVQAVRSAVAVQRALDRRNADLEDARQMRFRIGVNLGDVMIQGTDVLGEGVNIAARLEQMAPPAGIFVSGTVWEQIEGKVAFPCVYVGDEKVKNIARPVRTYRVSWEQAEAPSASFSGPPVAPALPDRPSIAVLPFTNMGSDIEQEYFADGISEDIITALSKWRWLFVIARNTSFVYKGKPIDIKQVGRELGVRYVLEGSVRKAGNRVRITAQLIEAATGRHLWGERYDRDLADAFAVQDEITDAVVGAIEPELRRVEQQRAARKSPEAMDAWDHHMRGMWRFHQFSPEDNVAAEGLIRRAITLDPEFAPGYAALARVYTQRIVFEWSEDPESDRKAAYAMARRAVELDDKDTYAHYTRAWASLLMREHDDAIGEAQKSIDLTPNFALGYYMLGVARVFRGRFEQAIDPFRRAMRLSPHEPLTFFFCYYSGLAQYHQGHYEEAARMARMGIAIRPTHMLYRVLAASHGQLGHTEEAQVALAEMRRLMPKAAERLWELMNPYFDSAHRAQFIDGLRKAGWAG